MSSFRVLALAVISIVSTASGARSQSDTLRLYSSSDRVSLDPNGFLFNPRWLNAPPKPPNIDKLCRFRVVTGHLDQRTLRTTGSGLCLSGDERSLLTLNEAGPTLGFGFICATSSQIGHVRGHVNWFPVTVTGQVFWGDFGAGTGEDRDITLELAPADTGAVTSGNDKWSGDRKSYHIELNYDETLALIGDQGGAWWHAVTRSLERNGTMRTLLNGRFAVVTGLFGLDAVHDFKAELHPVFAMAVLIDTARTPAGKVREQWAVLVRNRGNEGDCSGGSHPLITSDRDSIQDYVVDLGTWVGAGRPRVSIEASFSTDPARPPRVHTDSAHLYVAFPHHRPGPDAPGYLFVGTLLVEWPNEGPRSSVARFAAWLPPRDSALKLSPVPTEGIPVAAPLRELRVPRGIPQEAVRIATMARDSMARLRFRGAYLVRQQELDSTRGFRVAREPRVERNVQFLIPRPVLQMCQPRTGSLCRGPFRLVTAGTINTPRRLRPMVGVFVYAHGIFKHDDIRSAFAYRVDVRTDRFSRECDSVCLPGFVSGYSAHLSAILAPNSWRIFGGTLALYSIWGGGVSVVNWKSWGVGWSVGLGGQMNDRWLVELQNYGRTGRFRNYWTLNVGRMWTL